MNQLSLQQRVEQALAIAHHGAALAVSPLLEEQASQGDAAFQELLHQTNATIKALADALDRAVLYVENSSIKVGREDVLRFINSARVLAGRIP